MSTTITLAAELLRLLNIEPVLVEPDGHQLTVLRFQFPVSAVAQFEAGRLGWVTVRARGTQTRSVFPTKDLRDFPKAVARAVLAAMLELAAILEADPVAVGLDIPAHIG